MLDRLRTWLGEALLRLAVRVLGHAYFDEHMQLSESSAEDDVEDGIDSPPPMSVVLSDRATAMLLEGQRGNEPPETQAKPPRPLAGSIQARILRARSAGR